MVKHVFRISTYGGLYHEGEFVKETEKTVTYRWGERGRETRAEKRSLLVLETENPQGVLDAYNAAWKRYEARVSEARQTLQTLEQKRKFDALEAAKAEGRS